MHSYIYCSLDGQANFMLENLPLIVDLWQSFLANLVGIDLGPRPQLSQEALISSPLGLC